jgi:hypothetical protein
MPLIRIGALATFLILSAAPAAAVEHTIWHSPLRLQPSIDFPGVTMQQGLPATTMDAYSSSTGNKYVLLPLTLPSNVEIKGIELCYRVSNSATSVSQVRLTKTTTPDVAGVVYDDPTVRNSTTATCETSGPMTISVDAVVTLSIRIFFADTSHFVEIGGVGVIVEPLP